MTRPSFAKTVLSLLLLAGLLPRASAQFATQSAAPAKQAPPTPTPAQAASALGVCSSSHASAVNLNLSTPQTLISPDEKWKLLGIPGKSVFDSASVFLAPAAADSHKKWRIDWLHHRGSAWFSPDSHWLVLRDEFLRDDTSLRAFDLTGDSPREVHHVDDNIRRAIQKQIPKGMAAEFVKYPDVCFADGAPNTFLVLSDTPIVPRWSRMKGAPFFLRIVVTLPAATAVASRYTPKTPPPAPGPVINDDSGLVQPTPHKPEPAPTDAPADADAPK